MRLLPATCAAALVLSAAGAGYSASAATPEPVRALATSTVDALSKATDLGAVDAATPMQVAVTLPDPDAAAERALLAAQADPRSPQYQRFLTPQQWNDRFGVPAATYARARSFATHAGLKVVSEVGSRDYLLLEGPASAVEQTFGVQEHRFLFRGVSFVANTAAPTVPTATGIGGVLGLDTVHHANLRSLRTSASTTQQSLCAGTTCTGPLDISDLRSAYDVPAAVRGQGQQTAVFGEGEVKSVLADLKLFAKANKLRAVPLKVVSVGDDFKDTAGSGEWDLDTQSSTGIADGLTSETLYFGKDLSDASINGTYAKWADDTAGPKQANASFGECEPIAGGLATPVIPVPGVGGVALGTQSIPAFDAQETQLRKARAEGRTLFASSGDQGGACAIGIPNAFENNGVPALNVPAASVNAVGVGGTVLYTTGGTAPKRALERGLDAGGGGSSFSIHADAYQLGLSSVLPLQPCVVTQAGLPDTSGAQCRSLPDVSADSGDITVVVGGSGLNIISGGSPTSAAGTSLSSPLTMGMWADVQGALAKAHPKGLGFANLTFYKLGKSPTTYAKSFFDVVVGTNGQRVATPGYDQNTGLGVLDVAGAISSLSAAPPTTVKPVSTSPGTTPPSSGGGTTRPTGSLASTGLGATLPLTAVALLGGALLVSRRRV